MGCWVAGGLGLDVVDVEVSNCLILVKGSGRE